MGVTGEVRETDKVVPEPTIQDNGAGSPASVNPTPEPKKSDPKEPVFSYQSLATNPGALLSLAAILSALFYVSGWLSRSILLGRYGLTLLTTEKESALAMGVVFLIYCGPAIFIAVFDGNTDYSGKPSAKVIGRVALAMLLQLGLTLVFIFAAMNLLVPDQLRLTVQDTGSIALYIGWSIASLLIIARKRFKEIKMFLATFVVTLIGLFYNFSNSMAYRLKPEWGGFAYQDVNYRLSKDDKLKHGLLITGDSNYLAISDAPNAKAFLKFPPKGPSPYTLHIYKKDEVKEFQIQLLDH